MRNFILSVFLQICTLYSITQSVYAQYVCEPNNNSNNYRCASITPPGELSPGETPQFIMVTFDDAVNSLSQSFIDSFMVDIRNPNGLVAPRTYFINKANTQIELVQRLYEAGHEFANHTTTHNTGIETNFEDWLRELHEINFWLVNEVGIPSKQITGFRAPFLATNETMWRALDKVGFLYDSSVPEKIATPIVVSEGPDKYVWPHTLDNGAGLSCFANLCPEEPVNGLWEIPLWTWVDSTNFDYGAMDPSISSVEVFKELLEFNFMQRYTGNRAPLGIYLHAGQMWQRERQQAIKDFLQEKLDLPGVWVINMRGVVEWMRNPVSINEIENWFQQECHLGKCSEDISIPKEVGLLFPVNHSVKLRSDRFFGWNVNLNTDSYDIQISRNREFSEILVDDSVLEKTTYEFNNLPGSTLYFWRVRARNSLGAGEWSSVWEFTTDAISSVSSIENNLFPEFSLSQNYPNPFNATTSFEFSIPENNLVVIKIYDVAGSLVTELVNTRLSEGNYKARWDTNGIASGMYTYTLRAGNFSLSKKLILIK